MQTSRTPPSRPSTGSTTLRAGAGLGYDPAAAKRLLAEAGWRDRDGDGVLEDSAGRPFRFVLLTAQGNQERKDAMEMVQSDLRGIGVDVRTRVVEFNTLVAQTSDPKRRDFDAVLFGWLPEFRVDDSDILSCEGRDQPMRLAGYCDPEVNALLDSLARIPDRARSLPLWRRYQEIIARDQPFTFLYYPRRLEGVSRRLRGVHPDSRGDFVGVERWWIPPALRGGRPR